MKNNLKLILSTFTNQQHKNDCGIACLSSICKYSGVTLPQSQPHDVQLSLLQLQKLAQECGLHASCVRMDMESLTVNPCPCILYVINDAGEPHFIVHYGYNDKLGLHLVGDPDKKLEWISTEALAVKWTSYSALYFKHIRPRKGIDILFYPWNGVRLFRFIPQILWLGIPFLNIVAAFLGLTISLVIQKAIDPGIRNSERSFMIVMFILLLMISSARCLLNYLKQKLLANAIFNSDSELSHRLFTSIYRRLSTSKGITNYSPLNVIADVQKVHQAIALLIGVVFSDGILFMLMLGATYYYQPLLVMVEIASFMIMLVVVDHYLPLMLISFGHAGTPIVPGSPDIEADPDLKEPVDYLSEKYIKMNNDFSARAKLFATIAGKLNFSLEAVNTLNLLVALFLSILQLRSDQISYEVFLLTVLLCYTTVLLMGKISSQFFSIAQGVEMLRKHHSMRVCRPE